jgi:hypothetical protein
MEHKHEWKTERPCSGQVVLSCECGATVYVCPMGNSEVAVQVADGQISYIAI